MPVYNPNIPQSTDLVSQSQNQILQNFESLKYIPNGVVQFPDNGGTPAQNAQTQIFSQVSALTGFLELFIQRPTGSTEIPTPVEFTSYGATPWTYVTSGTPIDGFQGWTRLPSGLLIKFGLVGTGAAQGMPSGTSNTIDFPATTGPINIPAFTGAPSGVPNPLLIMAVNTQSLAGGGANGTLGYTVYTRPVSATQFFASIFAITPTVGVRAQFFWIAVGW